MTSIVGIEIEKDAQGQDAFIRIDLNKYRKQLEPFLQEIGLADELENEREKSLTIEEAKKRSIQKIRAWWNKVQN
jgi:hypothetical protein